MHGISSDEAIAAAVIWCVGALAALATTLRDANYRSCWRAAGAMGVGGFIAICTVGVLSTHYPSAVDSGLGTLACASMAGLVGKQSDQVIRWLFGIVFRVKFPDGNQDDKS